MRLGLPQSLAAIPRLLRASHGNRAPDVYRKEKSSQFWSRLVLVLILERTFDSYVDNNIENWRTHEPSSYRNRRSRHHTRGSIPGVSTEGRWCSGDPGLVI